MRKCERLRRNVVVWLKLKMQNDINPSPLTLTPRESLRMDYGSPLGFQPGFGGVRGFWLWNLRKAIPGHPAGSTVSQQTLDAALANLHPVAVPPSSAAKLGEFAHLRSFLQ